MWFEVLITDGAVISILRFAERSLLLFNEQYTLVIFHLAHLAVPKLTQIMQ